MQQNCPIYSLLCDGIEYKLIPCTSCKMYLMMPETDFHSWVQEQLGDIDLEKNALVLNCVNCIEKDTLIQETLKLNSEITYLNERVSSLRSIREGEDDINTSINSLANRFDVLNVDDFNENEPCNPTSIEGFSQDISVVVDIPVTSPVNTSIWEDDSTTLLPLHNTSEESDNTDLFDDILDNLHNDTSQLLKRKVSNNEDLTANGSTTELEILIPAEEDNIKTISADSELAATNVYLNISASETDATNQPTEESAEKSTSESRLSKQRTIPSFRQGNHIKTLILGDAAVKNLLLNDKIMRKDEYFRIANSNATLEELIDNAIFFMQKFLFGVTNIILQISFTAVSRGRTEKMKEKLHNFIKSMNTQKIRVTVCGPIPYPWMKNETFSRAYSMTKWLYLQYRSSDDDFHWVDCFELLWKHEQAFKRNHIKELTNYGNWLLEGAITDCILISD